MSMKTFEKPTSSFIFTVLLGITPISLLLSPGLCSVLIILLAAYSIFTRLENNKRENLNRIVVLSLVFYLVLHVVSLSYSNHVDKGFSLIIRRLPLLIFPFIFFRKLDKINYHLLLEVFLYGVALISFFTFGNALYRIYLNDEPLGTLFRHYHRFFYVSLLPYEIHPTYIGLFLVIAMAIVLYFQSLKGNKILHVLLFLFFVLNIYLLSSQMTSFICLVLGFVFFLKWVWNRSNKRIFVGVFLSGTLSAAILYINRISVVNFLIDKLEINNSGNILHRTLHFIENGDITRRKNWISALNVIENNIFFGVGVGDGAYEMQKIWESGTWIHDTLLNAHNQYLE